MPRRRQVRHVRRCNGTRRGRRAEGHRPVHRTTRLRRTGRIRGRHRPRRVVGRPDARRSRAGRVRRQSGTSRERRRSGGSRISAGWTIIGSISVGDREAGRLRRRSPRQRSGIHRGRPIRAGLPRKASRGTGAAVRVGGRSPQAALRLWRSIRARIDRARRYRVRAGRRRRKRGLGKRDASRDEGRQKRQTTCTKNSPSGHVACPSLEVCSRDNKKRTARRPSSPRCYYRPQLRCEFTRSAESNDFSP